MSKRRLGPKALRPIKDNSSIRAGVLASLSKKFNCQKLCEVGVKSGGLTEKLVNLIPNSVVVAVDPWRFYEDWPAWDDAKHKGHERAFDAVARRYPKRIIKMKMPSVEAAVEFQDGSLDLVFIDGDHSYAAVKADIEAWLPKVRSGGVLSGHDYKNHEKYGDYFSGVEKAVDERFGESVHVEPGHVWWVAV